MQKLFNRCSFIGQFSHRTGVSPFHPRPLAPFQSAFGAFIHRLLLGFGANVAKLHTRITAQECPIAVAVHLP